MSEPESETQWWDGQVWHETECSPMLGVRCRAVGSGPGWTITSTSDGLTEAEFRLRMRRALGWGVQSPKSRKRSGQEFGWQNATFVSDEGPGPYIGLGGEHPEIE